MNFQCFDFLSSAYQMQHLTFKFPLISTAHSHLTWNTLGRLRMAKLKVLVFSKNRNVILENKNLHRWKVSENSRMVCPTALWSYPMLIKAISLSSNTKMVWETDSVDIIRKRMASWHWYLMGTSKMTRCMAQDTKCVITKMYLRASSKMTKWSKGLSLKQMENLKSTKLDLDYLYLWAI